jgi:hypothetical protein
MSDDLVKWLRMAATGYGYERCAQAADRIEALEAALREIRDYEPERNSYAVALARKALGAQP